MSTNEGEIIAEDINTIIAFVSTFQRTIFVKSGYVDAVLKLLEVVKGKTGWQLPNSTEIFILNEVDISSTACSTELDQLISLLKTPQRGDRRVRQHYTCGPTILGNSGPCLPVQGGKFYIKGERTPIAFCRFSRNKECIEYYREIGTVGYFEDSDCKKLIRQYALSSWTCLGLF